MRISTEGRIPLLIRVIRRIVVLRLWRLLRSLFYIATATGTNSRSRDELTQSRLISHPIELLLLLLLLINLLLLLLMLQIDLMLLLLMLHLNLHLLLMRLLLDDLKVLRLLGLQLLLDKLLMRLLGLFNRLNELNNGWILRYRCGSRSGACLSAIIEYER